MAYATYDDYLGDYGGSLDENEFDCYAARAGGYLEVLTFGRCGGVIEPTVTRAVTMACCAVAEELHRQEHEPVLTAQSVGEWSRAYAPRKSSERRIGDAARLYLRGTGLLWRGWKRAVTADEG